MKWVEVILLRSTDSNRDVLKSKLQKLIKEVKTEKRNRTIQSFNRLLLSTDYCIHITHDSGNVEHGGSKLGLSLVSALREFGLVNHSIWIEMPGKP